MLEKLVVENLYRMHYLVHKITNKRLWFISTSIMPSRQDYQDYAFERQMSMVRRIRWSFHHERTLFFVEILW